ncbi:MAG: 2-aminoethylphosphonate--pyruvate transaminase [Anaerolineaceae bacterium]|nr:2-aminoethylphosphonate--pyruvate transaminase [Anaerolineaceae bacterium]
MVNIPSWKDKALFTPGPLTTSQTVKQAMLHDMGSRDTAFIEIIRDVRRRLVDLCASPDEYTAVLMPGSGTFGIEATLSSVVPPQGKLLILINGAYGSRIQKIAEVQHIAHTKLVYAENTQPDPAEMQAVLEKDRAITHVAVVHSETTTGIVNPIEVYGKIAKSHDCIFIVDAMSSFGAYPIDLRDCGIDYLVSSANKCIEGVPGFSFILARTEQLKSIRGYARTLSLDLLAQWEGLEGDGQFRFTPPTHVILAFHQALLELEQEGGVQSRAARYKQNYDITLAAMQEMGFQAYVEESKRGYSITSFYYPKHPNFNFQTFYKSLSDKGHIIYPGKLTHADCFRIGHIGRLNGVDVRALMTAVAETLKEMNIVISKRVEE